MTTVSIDLDQSAQDQSTQDRSTQDRSPAAPPRPPARTTPATALRDTVGVARRNLLHVARTPQLLLISVVQPVLFLIMFRYILGGAISVPGGNYVNFVVPAIFLETVLIGSMATSIGLAQDLKSGIVDRLRSLPMARSAVLSGRTLADLCRSTASLGIMIGLGVASGFRFQGAVPARLLGILLIILFGYTASWIYATIGLATKDPEAAQAAGVVPLFVLLFASSAFVPVETMPGWLQPFARNQPFSVTLSAVRALFEGGAASSFVWQSLAWCAGILVVFCTLAVRLYRTVA